MSARPYHKRFHSDALAGFMALDLEERGAYQTLLDMMYDRGGPLANNERLLAGYMGCSVRKWRTLFEALTQKGKIYADRNGEIFNSRVKKELENDAKTARKLAENGSKGGRTTVEKRKLSSENNESDQAALKPRSSLSHSPESIVQKPPNPQPICPPDLRAVIDAAGMSAPPNDRHLLAEWLALPDMQLERDILPIVRRVAANEMGRSGRAPFKLKLFDAAIREQHANDEAEKVRLRGVATRLEPKAAAG